MTHRTDIAIIGGGIIGLATAYELIRRFPDRSVTVVEKEDRLAAHQTGRNSGVIHSGIYYKPGTLRAQLSREGNASLVAFCRENDIPFELSGKLIAAVDESELPRLEALYERGRDHGLDVRLLSTDDAREMEPHLRCLRAIHVPSAGVVDFGRVAEVLGRKLIERGVRLLFGAKVTAIQRAGGRMLLTAGEHEIDTGLLITCAGLYSDRVARLAGERPTAKIIPFRGEYYELRDEARSLVRTMIYPVPDPRFPFLGVHLTRGVDGVVHAGPNAVLAFAREGYRWRDVNLRDLAETLTYPAFLRFAMPNLRYGAHEVARSLSRSLFTRALRRLVPEIRRGDLIPAQAGVRAQALDASGELVDDFRIVRSQDALHVLNAPSPAATSAFAIASHLVDTQHVQAGSDGQARFER